MSTERPLIRPFKNLDDLEKIVSGINLKVVSPSKVETMEKVHLQCRVVSNQRSTIC